MSVVEGGAPAKLSVLLGVLALCVTTCGADPDATTSDLTMTSNPAPTTSAPVAPTTTDTAATSAPTTVIASATTLPSATSELEPFSSGWIEIGLEDLSDKAFPPCCADTWHGEASPRLAPQGEALADGPYFVSTTWPNDPSQPLELELFRFEQCALLAENSCEPPPEGSEFSPTQLGVDGTESRIETLTLDGSVRVVVVGVGVAADDGFNVFVQGTGTDLARLAGSVEMAYSEVFADRFEAGQDPEVIIADVMANPVGGFIPAEGAFTFIPQQGPPLLFQTVLPYAADQEHRVAGRGTDVLAIRSIEIDDGHVTLSVYAARYS